MAMFYRSLIGAIALAVAACVWFLLTRTRRGFEWRAVGAGPEAAHASGIPGARRGDCRPGWASAG